jgi:hypothetical protein
MLAEAMALISTGIGVNYHSLQFSMLTNHSTDSHWCTNGASRYDFVDSKSSKVFILLFCRTPSSDTYCGTAPASEPEVKATASWILQNEVYQAFIDFHR